MMVISTVKAVILTTLLFLALFIGNASLFDFYLFYLVVTFSGLVIAFYIHKKIIYTADILNIFFLCIFLIYNMYSAEVFYYANYEYYFWPISAIILYIVMLLYLDEMTNIYFVRISLIIFILFFYVLVTPSIIDFLTINSSRYSFVFGPNMYYRVLSILMILILYLVHRLESKRFVMIMVFMMIPYALALIHTGSRGAVIIFAIVMYYFITQYIKIRRRIFLLLFLFILFLGVVWLSMFEIDMNTRLLNMDHKEGSSIGVRLSAYVYLFEHFTELVFSFGIGQSGFQNVLGVEGYFEYPHNLFLELIYYYGIIGVISIVYICVMLLFLIRNLGQLKENNNIYMWYIILILLFSTSFSGDFNDNYSFLSLVLILTRVQFLARYNVCK